MTKKSELPDGVDIDDVTLTLHQKGDSGGGDTDQDMTIQITDAGGGRYAVITTERWAVDDGDQIKQIIDYAMAIYTRREATNDKA